MQCIVHHHRHIRICIVVLVDLQFCKTWCSKPLLTAISVFLVLKLHGLLQFFANAQRRQRKIGTLVVSEKYPFTGFESYQKCLILLTLLHFASIEIANAILAFFWKKKIFSHKDCLAYISNTVDYRFNARAIRKLSSER